MTSGIILSDKVKWISFHSGYDFGYLLKVLTSSSLPQEESEFFELLKLYFPNIYDVKYLMKSCKNLKGGLQEVSEQLAIQRIGPQHQAGSDSLLTGAAFFKMRELFFEDNIDDTKYCGQLYGLGSSYMQNGANSSAYSGQYSDSNGSSNNSSSCSSSNNSSSNGDNGSGTPSLGTSTTAASSQSASASVASDSGHSNSATPPTVTAAS